MATHRHVFICGLNRSGTSVLHRLLRAHPEVSGFTDTGALEDEGQHLQTVIPAAHNYGGAGKFCFDARAYLTETSPLNTRENREKLLTEWGEYWDLRKPVLIEKSPPNLIRMRLLQAMFPESRFVIITRHPLAVALATMKWAKTNVRELVEHWVLAHQAAKRDTNSLRHAYWLRYEDFVANPHTALAALCNFIGIAPIHLSEPVKPDVNEKYFAEWKAIAQESPMQLARVRLLHALPNQFGYYFQEPYVRPMKAPAE